MKRILVAGMRPHWAMMGLRRAQVALVRTWSPRTPQRPQAALASAEPGAPGDAREDGVRTLHATPTTGVNSFAQPAVGAKPAAANRADFFPMGRF